MAVLLVGQELVPRVHVENGVETRRRPRVLLELLHLEPRVKVTSRSSPTFSSAVRARERVFTKLLNEEG